MLQTISRGVGWLVSHWRQGSVLTRTSLVCVSCLFLARRVLWQYTTPQNQSDISRALLWIDVYLVGCWIELAFLILLIFSLASGFWRKRKKKSLTMVEVQF